MALPVSFTPKSDDSASHAWAQITVAVGWTLLSENFKITESTLSAARMHVICHLEPEMSAPRAADLAVALTRDFIDITNHREPTDPWPQDRTMPLSERWGGAILRSAGKVPTWVFRKHYGDMRSLALLREKSGKKLDLLTLQQAQGGLREVIRRMAKVDNLPMESWSPERLDRVLQRIAAWSPGPCPQPVEVVEGARRTHTKNCPHCDRVVRLVNHNMLTLEQLRPPSIGVRPEHPIQLLAIQLHPDAVEHMPLLCAELPTSHRLGKDIVLVHPDKTAEAERVLRLAAEVGAPEAHHIRGASISGDGAWTSFGPVGTMHRHLRQQLAFRSWGAVEGLSPLPAMLPPPPSAKGAWTLAAVAAAALLLVTFAILQLPDGAVVDGDLDVVFTEGRGGTWVDLDMPEHHRLTVVSQTNGVLKVVLLSESASDKADLATGDGRYRLHTAGEGTLIVSHTNQLEEDLTGAMQWAQARDQPLQALAVRLSAESELQVRYHQRGNQPG